MGQEVGESAFQEIEKRIRREGWDVEVLQGSKPEDRSVILARPSDDGLVELFSDGRFAVQFGVDMEEMRNLLTGDQTEDMADDELVRVARYHLKTQADRFKKNLLALGLVPGEDATEDYYAITFEVQLDFSDPDKTMKRLRELLAPLRAPS